MMYVNPKFKKALEKIAKTVPYFDGDDKTRAAVLSYNFLIKQVILNLNPDPEVRQSAVIEADGGVDVTTILCLGLGISEQAAKALAEPIERKLRTLGLVTVAKKSGMTLNAKGLGALGSFGGPPKEKSGADAALKKVKGVYLRMTFDQILPALRIGHFTFSQPYKPFALLYKDYYAGDILDRGYTDEELVAIYKGLIFGDDSLTDSADEMPRPSESE